MNNVHLLVVDQSSSGSYHVKVIVDSKESGILYLSSEQFNLFSSGIKNICYENNVSFLVENPFDIETEDDEDLE
jgi:hypothetical protein